MVICLVTLMAAGVSRRDSEEPGVSSWRTRGGYMHQGQCMCAWVCVCADVGVCVCRYDMSVQVYVGVCVQV